MVTKRILLFGGNGQIGQALQNKRLPPDWHMGVLTRAECDFTKGNDIGRAMRDFGPSLVINAAAMTDVDACEKDRERALRINFDAVATIAAHCVECDAPLIQLSTDYVFDGRDGDRPYAPEDAMHPVNVYGDTKMMGEEAVRHGLYWHAILRTSLVFGALGENALTKMLRAIDTQDEIIAASDQIACPTDAGSVASALIVIAEALSNGKSGGFGTFHLCGDPAVSRFEFAQAVMQAYAPFTSRRPRLTGVASADIPGRAPRPPFSAMNCDKIRTVYGIEQTQWREALTAAVKQYVETRKDMP